MNKFTKALALGTTALAVGLTGASAYAQQVDQITITAQKREQTLQETPVSVAVVTGENIEQSQIRDAADLQTLVPSLRVAEFATATNTEFNLRGIGTSSFNPGLEPSVGVFIDGVYRPRSGAAINDLLAVERVEVIRGPQSTLFGRNTPAGVVSIITQAPEYEFGYQGELTVGNEGIRIARGTVTGPLSDEAAFRLDATTHQNDGFLRALDGRDFNNRDRISARGQLLFNPNDNLEIRVIADYGHIDENCCAAPFAFYDPLDFGALVGLGGTPATGPNPADTSPFAGVISIDGDVNTQLTTSGISGQVDYDFENFTFTSITAWRSYDEDQIFDADFSDLDLVSTRGIQNEYTSFTQEFRFTSTGDNRVDWMGGLFYYNNELDYANTTPYGADARAFFDAASAPAVADLAAAFGLPAGTGGITMLEFLLDMNQAAGVGAFVPLPSGNAALPTTPTEGFIATSHGLVSEEYDYDTEAWSVFGQLDFNLTDRFTVTVGGRYSDEDKEMVTVINQPDPISTFSFADLAQDLRLVIPAGPGATCDPLAFGVVGGDACGFLVPILLLQQGQAEALGGDPTLLNTLLALGISPTTPLTPEQAANPLLNPLLPFAVFQNFPPVSASDFPTSRNDTNFSGNIILSYDVSDTLNIYGSYSTGYKPGGFNVSTNATQTGLFEFQEETASSWEIGAKGVLGDNFQYAIAYFDQEVEDFQSNNFVGNGFALENAGSIEVSGIEFEGLLALSERLILTGGFTYLLDSKYGDYEFAPCPDRNVDGSGVWTGIDSTNFTLCELGNERTNDNGVTSSFNNLSGRDRGNSEFVGAITGTYTAPMGDRHEMIFRGEATHVSEFLHTTSQDPRPFARQDDFTLFNASVAFGRQDGGWQLQLWGRNLGDEEYTKGGFPSVGYLGTSYNAYVGDPLTYGVTLRVRR
jgi:outer membrane receptor protein involved in Fe transport